MSIEYALPARQAMENRKQRVSDWIAQRWEVLRNQNGKTDIRAVGAVALLGCLMFAVGLSQTNHGGAKVEHAPSGRVAAPATAAPAAPQARPKLTVEQARTFQAAADTEIEVVGSRGGDLGTRVIGWVGGLLVVQIFDNGNCSFRPDGQSFVKAEIAPGSFGTEPGEVGEWKEVTLREDTAGAWDIEGGDPNLNNPFWGGSQCLDHNPS